MGSSPISSTFVCIWATAGALCLWDRNPSRIHLLWVWKTLARCGCFFCFFWGGEGGSFEFNWPRGLLGRERMLTKLAAMDGLVGGGRGFVIPVVTFLTPLAWARVCGCRCGGGGGAGGGGRWCGGQIGCCVR